MMHYGVILQPAILANQRLVIVLDQFNSFGWENNQTHLIFVVN